MKMGEGQTHLQCLLDETERFLRTVSVQIDHFITFVPSAGPDRMRFSGMVCRMHMYMREENGLRKR